MAGTGAGAGVGVGTGAGVGIATGTGDTTLDDGTWNGFLAGTVLGLGS
jgi:hypothetical protein